MGAQIVISAINTVFDSLCADRAIASRHGCHRIDVFCGLLPVVGNPISNAIIVGIAFTVSPKALVALFLVCIHKPEYFLLARSSGGGSTIRSGSLLLALVLGGRAGNHPGRWSLLSGGVRLQGSRGRLSGPSRRAGAVRPPVLVLLFDATGEEEIEERSIRVAGAVTPPALGCAIDSLSSDKPAPAPGVRCVPWLGAWLLLAAGLNPRLT
jgi:hypothetical protein